MYILPYKDIYMISYISYIDIDIDIRDRNTDTERERVFLVLVLFLMSLHGRSINHHRGVERRTGRPIKGA